ncbi:MAG: GntP family permease [Proteobacteria bacterium]|nr:GntP family permease [Pseudomonadota bacterium]
MDLAISLGALAFLMLVAYRGYSVILFAPVAAMLAVVLTYPIAATPVYSGLFMVKMVSFIQLYFPVFLLGAVFGKVVEMSGFSESIVKAVIKLLGAERAMLAIVLVCAVLTYGGVSLFVVVFAVYPFAVEMFRSTNIPKRLIPGTIALGAFSFTMDALPGTPQIQNIIPTTFFQTTTWAAPILGTIGAVVVLLSGLAYLDWRRRSAQKAGEGYGTGHKNEPEAVPEEKLAHPLIALLPLLVVGLGNLAFLRLIPIIYGAKNEVSLVGLDHPIVTEIARVNGIWAVQYALLCGIVVCMAFSYKIVLSKFADGSKAAVAGALLASINTASEYGFGAVISSLPGFQFIKEALSAIPDPLIKEAITVTTLAGVTGSASGGLSIALAAMSNQFIAAAQAANIPLEVLHRVAAMASGGMDTLPHNGAVITLLTVTGLTHRDSYKDIFAVTCLKTVAVFVIIAVYYVTGLR